MVDERIAAPAEAMNGEVEPNEPGLFLHWKGRSQSRVLVPKPRVLEEIAEHSENDDAVFVSNTDGGRHTEWLNQMAPTMRLVHNLRATVGVSGATALLFLGIAAAAASALTPSTSLLAEGAAFPDLAATPNLTTGPGGWTAFGPTANYWGFGFAKNGDVIVIGLDQAPAAGPVKLFVARYTPAGAPVSRVSMDRRYLALPNAFVIDPTDDSVLMRLSPDRTGTVTINRIDSRTGKLVRAIRLPSGIFKIAVDRSGRMFGEGEHTIKIGNYYVSAYLVRLRFDGSPAAWYSEYLDAPVVTNRTTRRSIELPTQIGFGRDGRLLVLDRPDPGDLRRVNQPRPTLPGLVSLTANVRDPRRWSVPLEFRSGTARFLTWTNALTGITADGAGNVFLGEYIPNSAGSLPVGYRLRMFRKDGRQLASWGYHGDHTGLHWPSAPQVDVAGRLWVIDYDPAVRTSSIEVLAAPPGH